MKTFLRIVHLTDLHFGDSWDDKNGIPGLEVHDAHLARLLTQAVQDLKKHSPVDITRIVATGDLTTSGSEQAFRLATQFLRSREKHGRTLVVGLNDPQALWLPGNHDTWQDGQNMGMKASTGTTSPYNYPPFERVFAASAPDADPPLAGGPSCFPYRVVLHKADPCVLLYALDSTRLDLLPEMVGGKDGLDPHQYHYWACGYVDAEQLQRLRELVAQETPYDGQTIRLAAIHHPLAYYDTDSGMPEKIKTYKCSWSREDGQFPIYFQCTTPCLLG